MYNKIKKILVEKWEVIAYLFWGVLTTIVSWGSYIILELLFRNLANTNIVLFNRSFVCSILFANILSWAVAVIFAYITNKIRVFKSKSWSKKVILKEFSKFISSRILTGIIEIICVPLLVAFGLNQTILGIEGMLAKIIVSIVIVLLNYVLSKLFVFKSDKSKTI